MRQAEASTLLQEKYPRNHDICSWEKQWYNSLKAWLEAETRQERGKILSKRRKLLNQLIKTQTNQRNHDPNNSKQAEQPGLMDSPLEAQ